jgi:hypothetical protein
MRRTAAFALLLFVPLTPLSAGTILKVGDLITPRAGLTATLLPDGRVLVAGGARVTTLELVDARFGGASSALANATSSLPLLSHTATLLPDGQVLLTGGGYRTDGTDRGFGSFGSRALEAYRVDALTAVATLNDDRGHHETTLLADGRLLVTGGGWVNIGGFHIWRTFHQSAELIEGGTVRHLPLMTQARADHTATLLRDGRVLIAGGLDGTESLYDAIATAEIFDAATETFQAVEPMLHPRRGHTATLLQDGRVLIAGGAAEGAAEIFDPATNRFTSAADVGARAGHTATLLRDGKVLLAGGAEDAVLYDPRRDEVVERIALGRHLARHAAVLLPDGSVLLLGGGESYQEETAILRYTRNTRRRAARH